MRRPLPGTARKLRGQCFTYPALKFFKPGQKFLHLKNKEEGMVYLAWIAGLSAAEPQIWRMIGRKQRWNVNQRKSSGDEGQFEAILEVVTLCCSAFVRLAGSYQQERYTGLDPYRSDLPHGYG